jgi:carbonic anhydrase
MKASEEELHATIEARAGIPSNSQIRFHAFRDVEKNVREQITKLKSHNWVRSDLVIRGFVYDVHDGRLREVKT